jgi:hypothetical protein
LGGRELFKVQSTEIFVAKGMILDEKVQRTVIFVKNIVSMKERKNLRKGFRMYEKRFAPLRLSFYSGM